MKTRAIHSGASVPSAPRHRHVVLVSSCLIAGNILAGCGPIVDFPTRQIDVRHRVLMPEASVCHPVVVFDNQGRVVKTLAERGAGPWRSPDGSTIYFVRFGGPGIGVSDRHEAPASAGRLFRADALGGGESEIRLPDNVLPCEVKVSPSGRFLAVAGVQNWESGTLASIDESVLSYLPRMLYAFGLSDASWKDIGVVWPGGGEFAWSPGEDRLGVILAMDQSAMVVITALLQAQVVCTSQSEKDEHSVCAERNVPQTMTAPAGSATTSGPSSQFVSSRFDPQRWLGTDLLSKAPRSTVVGIWLPGADQVVYRVALYRPSYAGFTWMPDGHHLLLFSIDYHPVVLPQKDGDDTGFARFTCHCWDTQRNTLEQIPVPRPDAFAAVPAPGGGRYLLWICGNRGEALILTDARGRGPRQIATSLHTPFLPRWADANTITFLKKTESTAGGNKTEAAVHLISVNVKTMKAVDRVLQPSFLGSFDDTGSFLAP
jgi:hypothetical protein